MKRYMLFLAAILFAVIELSAEVVPESVAREFASNYMGTGNPVLSFSSLNDTQTKGASEPMFFAYNNPAGGWVIISANDCSVPVLAHSDSGSISLKDMPRNMRSFLYNAVSNIRKISGADIPSPEDISVAWRSRGIETKAGAYTQKILSTAQWHQSAPFNATVKSRIGTTQNLMTGCVATSMAIVLQYHKWPEHGTGFIPSYPCSNFYVPGTDISEYTYDWPNIPETIPYTPEQVSATADLVFHCGTMVEMDYGTESSGAQSAKVLPALVKYMSYSSQARYLAHSYYSSYEWLRMIREDIDASRPIIYSGHDSASDSGHSFVIDGYNSHGEVHVNWGWGSYYNTGWYSVNYLGGTKLIEEVFNHYGYAIFGLAPSTGAESEPVGLFLRTYIDLPYYEEYGMKVTSGRIARNSQFTLNFMIWNDSGNAYNGAVQAALFDMDGTVKEVIGSEKKLITEAPKAGYYGIDYLTGYPCMIRGHIAPGDYVGLLYRANDGNWVRMGAENNPEEEIYSIGKISATQVSYIYVPSSLTAGDLFFFDFVGSGKLPVSIVWTFDTKTIAPTQEAYTSVKLTSGTHLVKAEVTYMDGSSEKLTRKFTVL